MSFTVGPGFTVGAGFTIGAGGGVLPPGPGTNGVVGYSEMPPPVIAGFQLEDASATVNGSVGFTINNAAFTGIAISNLTANNYATLSALYPSTPVLGNCTWGPGSSVPSSPINVVSISGGSTIVFYIQGQSGAATYNYPFTLSA